MWLPILLAICTSIAASEAKVDEFSSGISSFASDFYQETVRSDTGNVIVSPYSVASALAFLSQATNGNSFEQIKNGLHLNGGKSEIADNYLQYHGLLQRDAGNVSFSVANQLFVQQGVPLNQHFKKVATEKFFSGVENVDFAKSAEAASTINHFVAEKTNNKIKDLVSADSFDENSRVVLINAIHMKAKWQQPFEQYQTYKEDFHANEEEKANVDFMHATEDFNYAALDDLDSSALEMKYLDSDLSLVVVLPNSRTGLSALETKLKDYGLAKAFDKLSWESVRVSIPKFKIEHEVKLNDVLKRMGISDIFEDGKSDLSGLLDNDERLKVSEAIHKAFISVDEDGTEAAAATAFAVSVESALIMTREPVSFRANHPFVYYIWDRKLKTPIFSGHVTRF